MNLNIEEWTSVTKNFIGYTRDKRHKFRKYIPKKEDPEKEKRLKKMKANSKKINRRKKK